MRVFGIANGLRIRGFLILLHIYNYGKYVGIGCPITSLFPNYLGVR